LRIQYFPKIGAILYLFLFVVIGIFIDAKKEEWADFNDSLLG